MHATRPASSPFAGKKIGLVLTGGGAKGAYEIGVWRALVDCGITTFTEIAGTSIGGLNGYLVARDNLEDAERLWRRLGERSPLRTSPMRLALGFLERVGIAVVLAVTTYVLLPAVGALSLVPLAPLVWLVPDSSNWYPLRAVLPMALVVATLGLARALRRTRLGRLSVKGVPYSVRDHRRFVFFSGVPWMFMAFALLPLVAVPAWTVWHDMAGLGRAQTWGLLLTPFALGLLAIALIVEPGLSSLSQIPLFAGDDLPRLLDALLTRDVGDDGKTTLKIGPKLFVSRLVERSISLPGSLTRLSPGHASVTTALGFEYLQLRDAPVATAREVLRSTGAIAGFLPRVYEDRSNTSFTVSGLPHIYYDAGQVDNTPIAALLEHNRCDVIIVVLLDHRITDPLEYLKTHVDSVNQRVRRLNEDISDAVWYGGLDGTRFIQPVRGSSDKLRDVQVIPIVPSRPLGGFFGGTLRFSRARIEAHMALGARDARVAIAQAVGGGGEGGN